jgi:hypothetical protein
MAEPILKKYPSIEQFRNVIRKVHDRARFSGLDEDGKAVFNPAVPLPVLTFRGTVKLHGTNAGVGFTFADPNTYWCQSRERIISPLDDNAGFAAHVYANREAFRATCDVVKRFALSDIDFSDCTGAVIYGEWCGGNIQKSVALNQIPKMFVVFGIKVFLADPGNDVDMHAWVPDAIVKELIPPNEDARIFNIWHFDTWSLDIDFNAPELVQNKLREITEAVELQCPVAKHFGVEGVGEGVVWKGVTEPYVGSDFMFKVKGEKHSASKVKTLAAVDIEKVNSIAACVDVIVTENRLQQGIEHLKLNNLDVSVQNLGPFLKWVAGDCAKEELDTIVGSGLEPKEVCKAVSNKARKWFFENYA